MNSIVPFDCGPRGFIVPNSISIYTLSRSPVCTRLTRFWHDLLTWSVLACASLGAGPLAHAADTLRPSVSRSASAAVTVAAPVTLLPEPLQVEGNGLVHMHGGRFLAPDIARIVNRGELVVAMLKVDNPPFFYTDKTGQWIGLDVSLAAALAKAIGVKLRINRDADTFNAVVDLLAAGKADLAISKLSRTLARSETIAFSNPYLTLNHALVLNRVKFAQLAQGRSLPEVIRSFDGSMGVIAKSSFANYAGINFPKARRFEYASWADIQSAVSKGEVVSAYRDEFEVKRLLKADPSLSLVLRTVTLKDLEDTLGIGVAIRDTTLLAYVNLFLVQRSDKLDIDKVLQALDH